jgi:hypothetical protein
MKHFRIVEWSSYQHYKDRDPPWIKLHRDLLTSRTWVSLDNDGRVLAVACMLVAAGTENQIPADPAYFMRRAYLSNEPDFAPLVAVGFIEEIKEVKDLGEKRKRSSSSRKQMLADDTECSSEAEESREEQSRSEAQARDARGTRLDPDWMPSEKDREFALSLGLNPDQVGAEFKDYWLALPGAKGKKLDWAGTFRNRCRDVSRRINPQKAVGAQPVRFNG